MSIFIIIEETRGGINPVHIIKRCLTIEITRKSLTFQGVGVVAD